MTTTCTTRISRIIAHFLSLRLSTFIVVDDVTWNGSIITSPRPSQLPVTIFVGYITRQELYRPVSLECSDCCCARRSQFAWSLGIQGKRASIIVLDSLTTNPMLQFADHDRHRDLESQDRPVQCLHRWPQWQEIQSTATTCSRLRMVAVAGIVHNSGGIGDRIFDHRQPASVGWRRGAEPRPWNRWESPVT